MEIPGRVHNGIVFLEGGQTLPEGARVMVRCRVSSARQESRKKKRVLLPLVPSRHPGTLHLTNERIAQILEEEEVSSFRKSLRKPKT